MTVPKLVTGAAERPGLVTDATEDAVRKGHDFGQERLQLQSGMAVAAPGQDGRH
jgi:hypothetical protein